LTSAQGYLQGGAVLIQCRDKSTDDQRRRNEAVALRELCAQYGAALIINDDVDLALAVGADGVHLGRDDAEPELARRMLGAQALIGVSCYASLERARWAQAQDADYVAFGSFHPSPTKPQAARATLTLLEQARTELRLPLVAIGGTAAGREAGLRAAGADAVAVCGAIAAADDPTAATRQLRAIAAVRDACSGGL
jgi:thiamine-phosphate pyrophosphorylase